MSAPRMNVPQSRPDVGAREVEAVQEVVSSGILSLGHRIRQFEDAFRQRLGIPHALGVSSGTAGLHLCVRALGLVAGDEVVTTPFSFVASVNCLEYEGVVPRFVDIEPRTLNFDLDAVEAAITPRTRAILPVHVFGQPCDMDRVRDLARRHDLAVIEDACEALGSSWKDQPVGTLGDAAVFAFYPNKQITTGEGGMVVTRDPRVATLVDSMRNQGRSDDGGWLRHERLGFNYRLDEMSAAVGEVQMSRLDELLGRRRRAAERYHELLWGLEGLSLPEVAPEADVHWFVYVVRLDEDLDRDEAMRLLGDRGVACRPYFPPIHLQPYFKDKYEHRPGDFPVAEAMARRTLSIPFFSRISEEEMEYVRECLVEVIALLRASGGR